MTNYIAEYLNAIRKGEKIVGKYVRLAYEMIERGTAERLFFFDSKKANKAIRFIEEFCHHYEGRSDLLQLELWQKAAVSVIFGIVDDNGTRVFREVLIVIGRKNGKTLFAAAIAAYITYIEAESGSKVFCLAPKLEQAQLVYDAFGAMVDAEPELAEITTKRRNDYYISEIKASVRKIAFNYKKSDGFNPNLAICDELAAWQGMQGIRQYEVIRSAFGARKQPLILSITTAGYEDDGVYDELIMRSTKVLNGDSEETRLFPLLYMIDDVDKWDDINELKKANPNMGVSVSEQFFLDEIAVAKNSLPKKTEFLVKYCNIKQNNSAAWLRAQSVEIISKRELTLDDFRSCYCVGGIDLSQTTDLTACSVVIEKWAELFCFTQFFMPKNKIKVLQEREGVPYELFVKQGLILPSGNNYVDYHDCFNWFVMLVEQYEILPLKVGYDRYSAQFLVQDMTAYGFHMDDVYQGENLSPVIKEFEGIVDDGTIHIGHNNLLKSHFLNVAMKQNLETRKVRPVKINQRDHIDGFVSVIDAMTVRQKWFDEIGAQLKNEG